MILGMSFVTFTVVHVVISLIGIASGIAVLLGMLNDKKLESATTLFLATTVLTSVTGFMFPFSQLLPSHVVGAISLVALAVALIAYYGQHLSGAWRSIYIVTATFALNQYTLAVSKLGAPLATGTVTSAPAGIACGVDCSEDFDDGTSVTLTAVPDAGSLFVTWIGGGCSGTGTCTVIMTSATGVTAMFN